MDATMPKQITITQFDYSAVDTDTRSKLIWLAGEFRKQGKTHQASGLAMGQILSEAHELFKEKSFREWVPVECGCCVRSAYRYISAYAEFGQCDNLSHIELSAMYALTNNEKAKKKALKLADKGVKVTHAMAQQLVKESKPDPEPAPKPTTDPLTEESGEEIQTDLGDMDDTGEDGRMDSDGTEPQETSSRPPRNGKDKPASSSTPPKQFDRSFWYKQWNHQIGPLVRLVDKIANNVGDSQCKSQTVVQDHLNTATEEMMEWLEIEEW